MKPKRIQRKRTKGWQLPDGAVCVTRPGKWGNPFIVSPKVNPGSRSGVGYIAVPTVEDAIGCFREMMLAKPEWVQQARAELRGKDLACFCKEGEPCHADVLLEIANAGEESFQCGACGRTFLSTPEDVELVSGHLCIAADRGLTQREGIEEIRSRAGERVQGEKKS